MSKLNPMCETCANLGQSCTGTTDPVWTGCVYRKADGMRIYAFAADPAMGYVTAYFTVNGKRESGLVCSQAGKLHVSTGAAITHNLQRHDFSAEQTAAYNAFCKGREFSVDYEEGIV